MGSPGSRETVTRTRPTACAREWKLKLGLSESLRRSLSTTNSVESTLGTVRRVSRNVKRWRPGMVRRWVAMGLLTAQKRFRRIKGHRDLPKLI